MNKIECKECGDWCVEKRATCDKCLAENNAAAQSLKRELVEALKYLADGLKRENSHIPSDIESLIARAEKTL